MVSQLAPLALGDDAEALYRRVLRTPPAPLSVHASRLAWTRARAASALTALVEQGLCHLDDDGTVEVEDPRTALERLITRAERTLEEQRTALERSRTLIPSYVADRRVGLSSPQTALLPWESVPAATSANVVELLWRSTTGPCLTVTTTADVGPGIDPDIAEMMLQESRRVDREQRTIYMADRVGEPVFDAHMRLWAKTGEEQRVLAGPLNEFVVFGGSVVMAQEHWGDPASDYVVIRDAMLVTVFAELFERLWAIAIPATPESDDEVAVLKLLARGMKDEAIARHLGIGVRTARRRVAGLLDRYGVETRFQLGVEVARRGLL